MKAHTVRTLQEAREDLERKGLSVRKWASMHDLSPTMVRGILAGKINYRIGKSHRAAVLLGIKVGEIVEQIPR